MQFRKYKNRKIYCIDTASYVNLPGLLALARSGVSIEIQDAYTRTDITSHVLLQAVATERTIDVGQVMSFIRGT